MSEEIKIQTENKCLCQSKGFRNFLTISLGSFVGVFCALSLFAALHKPPVFHPGFMGGFHKPPCFHHQMMHGPDCNCKFHRGHFKHFDKKDRGFDKDFQAKKLEKKD